ncbi:MAG: C45 family autoproteolytic acyltransferase/hydrolase, partial [Alphaproteobacteria bacterium]|nr:C45 family autoproteolytic acyltransferase/hydrolase [Alphaproteobacteria bacterium]
MTPLPLIDLSGDARNRGRIHGEALAASAAANVETYLARFEAGGIAREDALAEGARWHERIIRMDPDYAEEMAGIAEGAGLDPVHVGILNARWELSYTLFAREAMGCTSFAALPEATKSGTTLIGQNWDWLDGLIGHMAVLRCRRDDAPDFLCITQAGIAGGIMGLNEEGIGLAVNGMATDHEGAEPERKPFHLRVREILSAKHFAAALKAVVGTPRVCSGNYLLAHADGEAIDIEASPNDETALYPEDGMLAHANHFEKLDVTSTLHRNGTSTLFRARRLDRMMRQANRPIDIALMQELFTDHFSYPTGICR